MPNSCDFSNLKNVRTIKINSEGWITPILIEYGIGYPETEDSPHYYWRIRGTDHTFIIPMARLDYISSGDYGKHFSEALEGFRADFFEWKRTGFSAPWMQEYRDQFSKYIED